MNWSEIQRRPTDRTVRQFAALWILSFGMLALWQRANENFTAAYCLFATALIGGLIGLIMPSALRLIYVAWMMAAFPVGWIVSHVLLATVFYGVFTPIGLLLRLSGRDTLGLRPNPGRLTYWSPNPAKRDVSSYFRRY